MCGIVAVLPALPPERRSDVLPIVRKLESLRVPPVNARRGGLIGLERMRDALNTARRVLVEPQAEYQLLIDQLLAARLRLALTRIGHDLDTTERHMRASTAATQRELIRLRAMLWDLSHERMSRIDAVTDLLPYIRLSPRVVPASVATGYGAIETALRSLERIERATPKSTGLHVWVRGTSLSCSRETVEGALASAGRAGDGLAFTYTVATANARPGDNVAVLREAIAGDSELAKALSSLDAEVSVLASTHIAKCQAPRDFGQGTAERPRPHTAAVAQIGGSPTLDTAVVPGDQQEPVERRRICGRTRRPLLGSDPPLTRLTNALASARHPRAVIAQTYQMPDALMLGVQGAGASLYVGFAPTGWVVASEPHGVTGETRRYLRVAAPESMQEARTGSVLTLSREGAGELAGVRRYHLDQAEHPIRSHEIESVADR